MRRALRCVRVGIGLTMAAVVAVGCTAVSESTTTTATVAVTALTTSTTLASTSTIATTIVEDDQGAAAVLLGVEDLPAGFGWSAEHYGDEHLDPDVYAGIVMHLCDDPDVEGFGQWKIPTVPPLSELSVDGPAAAFYTGDRVQVEELVYEGTPARIEGAFDRLVTNFEECLEASAQDPAHGITPEYVEEGWHWQADRVPLDIGFFDGYAVRYYPADADGANQGSGWQMDHTVALVAAGDRLVLIEVFQDGAEKGVDVAAFSEIVRSALSRLDIDT